MTLAFHRWVTTLKEPPRPVDGIPWDPIRYPIDWPGWPRVRLDVRFFPPEDR
jgi:hypothetical protein